MVKLWKMLDNRKTLLAALAYAVLKLVESFGWVPPGWLEPGILAFGGLGLAHKTAKGKIT